MRRFDVDAGVREGVSTGELEELRRARKAVTAVQLAEALEVSPRTIYRDVSALMAMRTPIDGAASVGYLMRPGYDLPPLMIDREEVEVGLQLLNRTGDQDLQAAARRVAAKIADVLPGLRADELDDGRFVVSSFGAPTAADMGMLRSAVHDDEAGLERRQAIQPDQQERAIHAERHHAKTKHERHRDAASARTAAEIAARRPGRSPRASLPRHPNW